MIRFVEIMDLLLRDSVIANFEYWSEFIIRVQRETTNPNLALTEIFGNSRVPPLFCLRLRNNWWIGPRKPWDLAVDAFELKGDHPIPREAPMQAGLLLKMLDRAKILAVGLDGDQNLRLDLSDGRYLTVQSVGGDWTESWFLELPVDDPDRDQWSIVCDSAEGAIYGKVPAPTNDTA
jgi:hypothetical protein